MLINIYKKSWHVWLYKVLFLLAGHISRLAYAKNMKFGTKIVVNISTTTKKIILRIIW